MNVSIIIPALNEARLIAGAVRKAWAAGCCEVIVVDGGSTDATVQLARGDASQVLMSPVGRAVQQNLGARHAHGDVLLFLHADTWLEPSGVAPIVEVLANPAIVAGAFRQRIGADGLLYRLLERGNAWRVLHRGIAYGDQGIFLRRGVFDQLGGFPEVGLMEDLLLMKRLRRLSRPVLLPGPLHISPRRWQRHGVVAQIVRTWCLLAAARLGVSPNRLAAFYPPHGDQ